MSFGSSLEKYAIKTIEKLDTVSYNATVLIFSSVVFDTPIDKGDLRGAWTPAVGSTNVVSKERRDPTGELVIEDIKLTVKPSSLNTLTNSLPYAAVVEYGLYPNPPKKQTGKTQSGFSVQAPFGMISPNVLRWNRFVAQAVKLAT